MLVNKRNKTNINVPQLEINGIQLKEVGKMICLGDVFNSKGNNDDLMEDRVKRGTAAAVSIHGFMREVSVGIHTISVYILLHRAIFLASILFNAQAWSNLTEKNISKLSSMQLKFLKKSMKVKQAVANSFVYLELGVLPVEYEMHKRQMSFLHHIIHLDKNDPVRKMWEYQKLLPDHNNWWNCVEKLLIKYGIEVSEENIKNMSKESFKEKIKKAVLKVAFEELKIECKGKEKTKHLTYQEFTTQSYLTALYPNLSRIIFKCRSQTLNIKAHMRYKYQEDQCCRWCGISDESLQHVVNCGSHEYAISDVEKIIQQGQDLKVLSEIAERVEDFLERVEV